MKKDDARKDKKAVKSSELPVKAAIKAKKDKNTGEGQDEIPSIH